MFKQEQIRTNFKLSDQTCDVSQSLHTAGCILCKTMNGRMVINQMLLKALEYLLKASVKKPKQKWHIDYLKSFITSKCKKSHILFKQDIKTTKIMQNRYTRFV